jgi:eukaryotic-like serine/threonine-protein kinase
VSPIKIIDGKYEIVRQLGEGGMGAVYEARHKGTGRRVAVKVIVSEELLKDNDMVKRFQREARATGSIESQHIAHVLDTGVDHERGYPYLVMEYLRGQDISQAIQRIGHISPDLALRITAQACIGLQRAHEAGVTHRDIKPANLYLAEQDGGEVFVKLLDFGIAKINIEKMMSAESAALTRSGAMLGSPLYMSPEQAKGSKSIDHRTDLWSLGVVLYQALSGVTPYGHCDTLGGLLFAICSEEPRIVQDYAPWVAPEVADVVRRALTIDPAHRFQSAEEMGSAIRALLPHGRSIQTEMFTPLAPHLRSIVAARLTVSPSAPPPGRVSGQLAQQGELATTTTAAGAPVPATNTASGLAQSHASAPRRPSAVPVALAGLATLVIFGGGGFGAWHLLHKPPPPLDTTVASVAIQPPQALAAAASSPPSNAPEPPKPVRLAIKAPADAKVEIDEVTTPVSHGGVDLTGTLGSTHHVKLSRGKQVTVADVAITNDGAIPPTLELEAAPPISPIGAPPAAQPPRRAAPVLAGAAPAGASPAATPAVQPGAARTSTPAQPQVARDFN